MLLADRARKTGVVFTGADTGAVADVAGQVAEVLHHVSPVPPVGAPRDAVLAAVIADRRRRDLQRLQRAEDLRRRVLAPDPLAPYDPSPAAGVAVSG